MASSAPSFRAVLAREEIASAAEGVLSTVGPRSEVALVHAVKIERVAAGLRLTTTDLERHRQITVPAAEVPENAPAVCVSAKMFAEILKDLPPAPVTLQTRDGMLAIECGSAQFRLAMFNAEEFPAVHPAKGKSFQVPGPTFSMLVNGVAFAASTDESRPALQGICWEIKDGAMVMVATNGHQLALKEAIVEGAVARASVVVPASAMDLLARYARAEGDQVRVTVADDKITLGTDRATTTVRLVADPFPNYAAVIPTQSSGTIEVDAGALRQTLQRVNHIADATNASPVDLSFADGRMRMSSTAPDVGDARDELPAKLDGEVGPARVNGHYLASMLDHLGGETARVHYLSATRALRIEPLNGPVAPLTRSTLVVMPQMVAPEAVIVHDEGVRVTATAGVETPAAPAPATAITVA